MPWGENNRSGDETARERWPGDLARDGTGTGDATWPRTQASQDFMPGETWVRGYTCLSYTDANLLHVALHRVVV